MRVAGDGLGGIAGEVDEDLLRGDDDVDGVAVGFDVKGAVGRELHRLSEPGCRRSRRGTCTRSRDWRR